MKKIFVYLISWMVMFQPILLQAQIVVEPSAGNQPLLDTAPNGVPIVNIIAPSGAGVSVNQFTDFNVGTEGVIINNGETTGVSQLGGAIYQNPLFQGGAGATTILNWTTGTNRSQLNGFTEIFGRRANYIMANPNGITCNGCGFINTPRVSLTTGNPLLSGGQITGFDVKNGDVEITGEGLNASEIDYFEIISRTAKITGQINAKDLKVVAGQNKYDYQTKEITAQNDGSAKPVVAIDVSNLGSIYAGRIAMVSTEDGVGVKSEADMIANAGDVEINSNGDIEYKTISSAENIKISARNKVIQTERASADGNIEISAKEIEIQKNDSIAMIDGNIYAGENLIMTATEDITNNGEVFSEADATITTNGLLTNNGGISSLSALTINAGAIDNTENALLFSKTDMNFTADQITNTKGNIYSNGNMLITARTGTSDGEIYNFAGWIKANQNMTLNSDTLQNIGEDSGSYTVYWENLRGWPAYGTGWALTDIQRTTPEITTTPAIIESGHDMHLVNNTMLNQSSDIVAANNLNIESTLIQNMRSHQVATLRRHWVLQGRDKWGSQEWAHSYPSFQANVYSDTPAQIIAGNNLYLLDGATIEEDQSDRLSKTFHTDSPTLDLSSNLIALNTDGNFEVIPIDGRIFQVVDGKKYLVETNNLYANTFELMNSQYFLDRMGMGDKVQDRLFLGDAYYESELIAKQVREDRGELFVAGTNAQNQREILWNNTALVADEIQLALGVELTFDQVAQLRSPIVWYVEEVVDLGNGRTETALVPRVYYPIEGTDTSKIVGGILRGKNVQITSTRDVNSSGKISAENNIDISAKNINGQGLDLDAKDIALTTTEDVNLNALIGSSKTTGGGVISKLANKGKIIAENLNINTDGNAIISGTDVDVSENAEIIAEKNVTIGSNQIHNLTQSGVRGSDNYMYEESAENVGSNVNVGKNLTIAGNNINVVGSKINAGETVDLDATENINVVASRDTDIKEMAYANEGNFSSTTHKEIHIKNTHNLAGISGKNVNLNSENDTNIIGGEISADENLTVDAKGNINTAGVKDSQYDMVYHMESDFDAVGALVTVAGAALTGPSGMQGGFDLAKDAEKGYADANTKYDETVINSMLSSGNNLSLISANDATFVSTDLLSDGLTTVDATGDILVGTMSEEHMSEHSRTEFGGDIVGSFVGGAMTGVAANLNHMVAGGNILGNSDPMAKIIHEKVGEDLLNSIGELTDTIDNSARQATRAETTDSMRIDTVLQKESNILTENLETISGNNTSILGSNVVVNQNADIQTGGDLIVGGVQETSSKTEIHEELSFDNVDFSHTNSSASVHLTQKKEKSEHTETSSTNKGSNIQVGGDFSATSDKGITIQGSEISANENVNLNAENDVQILAGQNTFTTSDSYSNISNTTTGTVGNAIVGAVDTAYQTAEGFDGWEDTSSSHINNTARTLQATLDTFAISQALASAGSATTSLGTLGFYASGSMTQTEEKSTSFTEQTQAVDAMIFGNNINVNAGETAQVKGSIVVAENDININAKDIVIESDQDKFESGSKSSTKSLTTTISTTGIALPTWSESTSESSTINTSQHHSGIQAGGSLNTNSTNDTKIAGANLEAEDVNITTGGDLNVESRQDITTAHSESQSISVGNNMGFSVSESNENTAWTNQITTIDGQNLTINTNDLNLTGAVIDGENATINADKIIATDLVDHSYSDNASVSVGANIGGSIASFGDTPPENPSNDPNMISTVDLGFGKGYSDKEGITKATISENATINAEVEGDLNRDTNNVQIITKDESDQIDADLSIDTDIVSEQYWNNVYNTGENLQELNDNFSDATGIDIADGISDGYNFVSDVFTASPEPTDFKTQAMLSGKNLELDPALRTDVAFMGAVIGGLALVSLGANFLTRGDGDVVAGAEDFMTEKTDMLSAAMSGNRVMDEGGNRYFVSPETGEQYHVSTTGLELAGAGLALQGVGKGLAGKGKTGTTTGGTATSSSASNANAQSALRSKLSGLQNAQNNASRVRTLPDGRVRYYTQEVPASTPGPTRGRSFATEYNPATGQTRQWMETYNHSGQVNRVHPKSVNGQPVSSQHYPPTAKELGK